MVCFLELLFPPILFLETKYSFQRAVLREQNRNIIPGIQVGISGLEKLRKQKEKNKDKNLAEKKSVKKLALSKTTVPNEAFNLKSGNTLQTKGN